jgi:hypothetical protein
LEFELPLLFLVNDGRVKVACGFSSKLTLGRKGNGDEAEEMLWLNL